MRYLSIMRINYSQQPVFGANLISKTSIKSLDPISEEYNDVEASFVEINPMDRRDRDSVNDAVFSWKNDLYGFHISNTMEKMAVSFDDTSSDKIYAITTQNDRYWKLNPDSIKALAHVFETQKRVRVVFLQVDPGLVYAKSNPNYKHVGKGMIDSLKEKYNDRSITLISSNTATKFYEKQGFEHCDDIENRLTWNKEAEENSEYKNEYW